MKCLGTFIILAVLNLVAVLAGPPPTIYIKSGDFEYSIPGGTDFVIASTPVNKKAKTLTVKPYVTYNNKRYNTKYFSGYFKDSAVEKIIFPNTFTNEIFMSGFETAKKLKVIQIDTPKARIHKSYADSVDRNVLIQGKGVEGMMLQFAKEIIEEIGIDNIDYDPRDTYRSQCFLYTLAKFINLNFKYIPIQYGENVETGIHTLLYRSGNSLGFARALRILATAGGYDKNAIRVGGDDMMFGWTYVEFQRKWYILDVYHNNFNPRDLCNTNVFDANSNAHVAANNGYYGKGVSLNNDVCTIFHGMFGYEGEVGNPTKENFKKWLKANNLGTLL